MKPFVSISFQSRISNNEEEIFFLPVRLAGLGLRDPNKTVLLHASHQSWAHKVVQESTNFVVAEHLSRLKKTVSQTHHKNNDADLARLNMLIHVFARTTTCFKATSGTSFWLSSSPLERYHFFLQYATCDILLTCLHAVMDVELTSHCNMGCTGRKVAW